jgi:drug/metabolite transporter (DMT)-like permease
MDPRLKKRITMFYFAGVINIVLGVYVVIEGRAFLPPDTARWLALFFFAFAAVDFWFPRMLKRKWQDMQAQLAARQAAPGGGTGNDGKK